MYTEHAELVCRAHVLDIAIAIPPIKLINIEHYAIKETNEGNRGSVFTK